MTSAHLPPEATTPGPPGRLGPKAVRRWVGRNRLGTMGGLVIGVLAVMAIAPGLFAPHSATAEIGPVFGPPTWAHPLGLDDGGADVLSESIYGARASLLISAAAAAIAVAVGGVVGILSGYFGGWTDLVAMRVADYVIVIPTIPLAVVIAALFGAKLELLILLIGLLNWATTARVLRAQTKTLRNRTYIRRIRTVGAGHARILWRHVLPQVGPLLIANTVLTIAIAIYTESALSFLGLGDPTSVTWGQMIHDAFMRTALTTGAWWAFMVPGFLITAYAIACHWLGQSLERSLNPRIDSAFLGPRSFRYLGVQPPTRRP